MIEQLRAFTYERQRLGQAAPNAARALNDVIAVYSSHPSAPLSLHARAKKMTGAQFRKLDVLRLPAMRMSIHLLPAQTAHLAFHATPAPPADRKKRMKHFKFTEKRYEELREQILKAATEPLTLPELREKVGAEPKEFKGISAQMTRDGELLRIGAKGLRSNELGYVANELDEADADEALAWLAGEYLRAFGPIRVKDFIWWAGVTATRAKQALAAHDTEELDDGLLIRAEDRKAFEKAKQAERRRPAPQVGQLHDGLRARRARPLRPPRRRQAVLRLPRRRAAGDPRRRPGGGNVGEGRGRAVRQGPRQDAQGDRRAPRRRQGVPGLT